MSARSWTFCIAMLAVAAPALAQRDFSEVEIKTTKVREGIYMLEGAGGNIGVSAGSDGVFLIDDQYAPLTDKIVAAVKAIDTRPIRFVLNTHWHGDHTGGNENLGAQGTLIVAHDNVRKQMKVEHFFELWNQTSPPAAEGALPVVTFSDTVTFHINDLTIYAFHVAPAHTDGDSMVHFKEANVLHMGDVFFNGTYPFIDVPTGGSVAGMIAACDVALELVDEETTIIPGHGPLANRKALIEYRGMLKGVERAVKPLVEEGLSLEEIQAENPLAPFDEKWGQGFINSEQMVTIAYQGMTRGS